MTWRRPDTVPVGQIWRSFEKNGKRFYIKDVDDKDIERCIEFGEKWFLMDEPLSKCLGITSDPQSLYSIRSNWRSFLAQGCSLACWVEAPGAPDGDELVGLAVSLVRSRRDPEGDLREEKGEQWRKLLATLIQIEKTVNVFDYYNVESYLSCDVLTVAREWRGYNIGAELFRAAESMASALGLPVLATIVTALPSQIIASRCGYQVLSEMKYSKMLSHGIDYSTSTCDRAKVVGMRVSTHKL